MKMRIIISLKAYGELTVSELCNYAIAEQPTMSRALDGLERQGMVRRQQSEVDSRLRLISLTDGGLRLFNRIYPEVSRVNAALIAGFSATEGEDFVMRLRQMVRSLRSL
ncbi:MAG: MarR family winged helix-turn-helix transcriptional regulator [Paracoccus sp. (in: a-proteobacteria)]